MILISVAVISLCVGGAYGMSSACITPDRKSGECIFLTKCESLIALAKKPRLTNQDVTLLRKSVCGSNEDVSFTSKVCCPIKGEPELAYSIDGPNNGFEPATNNLCPSSEQHTVIEEDRSTGPHRLPRLVMETPESFTYSAEGCQAQMTAFPPDPSTQCCGEATSVENKIIGVGGQATSIDEHPWTVLIEYRIKIDDSISLTCGGSLISGKYVLTAGHCISGRILETARPERVRLGEFDTSNEGIDCVPAAGGGEDCTDGAISFDIEETIPHPKYRAQSKRHDIGLIRLEGTAPYTDFIRPICLPNKDLTLPENMPPSFTMSVVGWGKTEFKEISNVKVQVSLPFVSMDKCQPEFDKVGRTVRLWRGQLCAGGAKGRDACKGDSGGPLVYENQTRFELIGVVSFGSGLECGGDGVPGIYTNVYEYLDWIKSVIVA